jgi:hypothetical protein
MELSAERKAILAEISQVLLGAFEAISGEADRGLGQARQVTDVLLRHEAQQNLGRISRENRTALESLRREPTIARVDVEWLDTNKSESLYVCRASVAGVVPSGLTGRLVSYRSPIGRLAEMPAGSYEEILTPRGRREARVRERVQVHPSRDRDGWDSLDNLFDLAEWQMVVASIRRLLQYQSTEAAPAVDFLAQFIAAAEEQEIYQRERRRKTVDRMSLRDQPVLDQYQGLIFRLPLDRQVLLLGPPGTGKTTTLIQRLAQKRTEEALTTEELERLDEHGIKEEFLSDTGWAMFSPTELLKLYVRDAFNRQGVPASSLNLRTWEAERTALGRDTLRFLRGANFGRFTIAETDDILLDCSSPALAALHDAFAPIVDSEILGRCARAMKWMADSPDNDAQVVLAQVKQRLPLGDFSIDSIHALAQDTELFRAPLARLTEGIDKQQKALANSMLGPDPSKRLNDLAQALRASSATPSALEEEDDQEETNEIAGSEAADQPDSALDLAVKSLLRAVRWLATAAVEGRTQKARGSTSVVLDVLADRIPPSEPLRQLGERIQFRSRLRVVSGSARALISEVPTIYSRFKRDCAEKGLWFRQQSGVRSNELSPSETDVVILVMLRNARRALRTLGHAQWLQEIRGRYLTQVYVDEATDFSSVQLACMLELTNPGLRSWFACGDFRQRITRSGILGPEDVRWIQTKTGIESIDIREIAAEYRQSDRLKGLAEALSAGTARASDTMAGANEKDDPAPLLVEGVSGNPLASWLTARIVEVERSVGRLPSVAIFVDGENQIDPLVSSMRGMLAERTLQIVGCRGGRDVGNAQEIRVFDIQHVKGLEFEAVFFVGVDTLAQRVPDLFQKYIYVGITRAASFLGITCEGGLPSGMEAVRPLFSNATWG